MYSPNLTEGTCLSIAMETGDADEEYARGRNWHWWEHRYQVTQDLAKVAVPFVSWEPKCNLPGQGRNMPNSQMVNIRDLSDNVLYQTEKTIWHHAPITYSIYCNVQ